MNKIKLILFLLIFHIETSAQTVLLGMDSKSVGEINERGQNLKKFSHAYFRLGFLASKDNAGARIIYGNSVNLGLGVRKKYKISPIYSIGVDAELQYTDYKLKQINGKILPDTVINNISGRLDYSSLGLGFFNRFNVDPNRGNFIGSFIDLGMMGEFHFSIRSISKNKMPDETILKSVVKNLQYTNNTSVKIFARLGLGHFSIYGSYRLTYQFVTSSIYPELPRFILGMELGMF